MTTSADIFSMELPTVCKTKDCVSRPDTGPVGSDYSRDRSSEVSRDKNDKSFADHLENNASPKERPITNERNDQRSQSSERPTEAPSSTEYGIKSAWSDLKPTTSQGIIFSALDNILTREPILKLRATPATSTKSP